MGERNFVRCMKNAPYSPSLSTRNCGFDLRNISVFLTFTNHKKNEGEKEWRKEKLN